MKFENKKTKVIGVGGAGMNTIKNLIDLNIEGVTFVSINTDSSSFKKSKARINLLIGKKITKGKSANGNPLIGRGAAFENAHDLKELFTDCHLAFIIAGLGGGTGTGTAPVIANFLKNAGSKVIVIVSTPFSFEGRKREKLAYECLASFGNITDRIIVTPNDRIRDGVPKNDTILSMFKKADEKIFHLINSMMKISE